jgi:NAD(P)-dependent dehydrogenase (short-subunit alcohol dehydrogenase family)
MSHTSARRFEGKVVLVTGGAGAIGAAACRRFADEGARLAILDRDHDRALALANELREARCDALVIAADVGSPTDVDKAIAKIAARFGSLDVLFNNAGISGKVDSAHELAIDDWDEIIRTNLRGVFLVQRAAAILRASTQCSVLLASPPSTPPHLESASTRSALG